MSLLVDGGAEVHESGERKVAGSLTCLGCGYTVNLSALDRLPRCPACGGNRFRRHRLFESRTMDVGAVEMAEEPPAWLDEIREEATEAGPYLAYEAGGQPVMVELEEG